MHHFLIDHSIPLRESPSLADSAVALVILDLALVVVILAQSWPSVA